MVWAPPGVEIKTPEHWPLKRGEVKHVGDPVAVVVATSRAAAMDAAEDVIVEYDPKPAVVEPEAALEDGAPLVWEEFGTNKTHEWAVAGRRLRRRRGRGGGDRRGALRQPPHLRRADRAALLGRREPAGTS